MCFDCRSRFKLVVDGAGGLGLSDYGPHAKRVMGEKSISTEVCDFPPC